MSDDVVYMAQRGTPEQWEAFLNMGKDDQLAEAKEQLTLALDGWPEGSRYEYVYRDPQGCTGDHASCVYLAGSEIGGNEYPSCLIGTVLWRLGAPLAPMRELNGVAGLVTEAGWPIHPTVVATWTAAQAAQDQGVMWGVAVFIGCAVGSVL